MDAFQRHKSHNAEAICMPKALQLPSMYKSEDALYHRSPPSLRSHPPSAAQALGEAPADWVALRVPLRERIAEIARGTASGPGPPSAAALLPWTRARAAGLLRSWSRHPLQSSARRWRPRWSA